MFHYILHRALKLKGSLQQPGKSTFYNKLLFRKIVRMDLTIRKSKQNAIYLQTIILSSINAPGFAHKV